eukprot:Rmarinus@m.3356
MRQQLVGLPIVTLSLGRMRLYAGVRKMNTSVKVPVFHATIGPLLLMAVLILSLVFVTKGTKVMGTYPAKMLMSAPCRLVRKVWFVLILMGHTSAGAGPVPTWTTMAASLAPTMRIPLTGQHHQLLVCVMMGIPEMAPYLVLT